MMPDRTQGGACLFSPKQHAVMFGLLAREICRHFGTDADALLLRAVETYGEERGRRMAARCRKNGDPPDDMASYFAYCEWSWPGESLRTENDPQCSHVSFRMLKCPWHTAWQESGLADYGFYYCRCVDHAILKGFNPALRLSLLSCLPKNPDEGCVFHWESAENTPALAERQKRIQQRLHGTQVKDFLYHTAHLYSTLLRCAAETNPQAATLVEAQAGAEFALRFGSDALRQVQEAAKGNFTAV